RAPRPDCKPDRETQTAVESSTVDGSRVRRPAILTGFALTPSGGGGPLEGTVAATPAWLAALPRPTPAPGRALQADRGPVAGRPGPDDGRPRVRAAQPRERAGPECGGVAREASCRLGWRGPAGAGEESPGAARPGGASRWAARPVLPLPRPARRAPGWPGAGD